jgi:hypothetical protein
VCVTDNYPFARSQCRLKVFQAANLYQARQSASLPGQAYSINSLAGFLTEEVMGYPGSLCLAQ